MIDALKELYARDLNRLKHEITLYSNDEALWKIDHLIQNSGGNLCLHLIGNLKTYIGNGLAGNTYVRQRDEEFSTKYVARETLYDDIDEVREIVHQGLSNMSHDDLTAAFPMLIWEVERDMAFTLVHLHSHLNYHLGQINYHRRILDKM